MKTLLISLSLLFSMAFGNQTDINSDIANMAPLLIIETIGTGPCQFVGTLDQTTHNFYNRRGQIDWVFSNGTTVSSSNQTVATAMPPGQYTVQLQVGASQSEVYSFVVPVCANPPLDE